MHLLGQASFWQALVSRALPSHGFPFIWGLGELQSRILVITPSPHVTEQDDHGDQWLQPPSCLTKGIMIYGQYKYLIYTGDKIVLREVKEITLISSVQFSSVQSLSRV